MIDKFMPTKNNPYIHFKYDKEKPYCFVAYNIYVIFL